jgi:hypothetical protein
MSNHLGIHDLKALVRSGAPVRFTRSFKKSAADWLDATAADCERIAITEVRRVERTYDHYRFISMENPHELEFNTVVFFDVRYRIPGEQVNRSVTLTSDGCLSDRVSEENGPPVFRRAKREKAESSEKTFLPVCPCGRIGEIGKEFRCCGGEMLRLSGTRRALERYLEATECEL